MKKETIISLSLIALGFLFECAYLTVDNTFFDAKFWITGIFCIIIGTIGLWLFTIIPWMESNRNRV